MPHDDLPRAQQRAIRRGLLEVSRIKVAEIRATRHQQAQEAVAVESAAARQRIADLGGIGALDRRSYNQEKAAMLDRLRRAERG